MHQKYNTLLDVMREYEKVGICLSGGSGSAGRRDRLAQRLRLPPHMSANALLEAVNLLYSKEEYESALAAVTEEEQV